MAQFSRSLCTFLSLNVWSMPSNCTVSSTMCERHVVMYFQQVWAARTDEFILWALIFWLMQVSRPYKQAEFDIIFGEGICTTVSNSLRVSVFATGTILGTTVDSFLSTVGLTLTLGLTWGIVILCARRVVFLIVPKCWAWSLKRDRGTASGTTGVSCLRVNWAKTLRFRRFFIKWLLWEPAYYENCADIFPSLSISLVGCSECLCSLHELVTYCFFFLQVRSG